MGKVIRLIWNTFMTVACAIGELFAVVYTSMTALASGPIEARLGMASLQVIDGLQNLTQPGWIAPAVQQLGRWASQAPARILTALAILGWLSIRNRGAHRCWLRVRDAWREIFGTRSMAVQQPNQGDFSGQKLEGITGTRTTELTSATGRGAGSVTTK